MGPCPHGAAGLHHLALPEAQLPSSSLSVCSGQLSPGPGRLPCVVAPLPSSPALGDDHKSFWSGSLLCNPRLNFSEGVAGSILSPALLSHSCSHPNPAGVALKCHLPCCLRGLNALLFSPSPPCRPSPVGLGRSPVRDDFFGKAKALLQCLSSSWLPLYPTSSHAS